MTFQWRGQGRFRDLVVTRTSPLNKRLKYKVLVVPYEDWSTGLWALLCEELERQSAKQERNTAGVTGARGKK